MLNLDTNLLTVEDVANFLQISQRTVYDNSRKLGGFYPHGLRVLRFRPEVIYGNMEGQETEGMGLRVPISKEIIRGGRFCNTRECGSGKSKTQGRVKGEEKPDRHRLRDNG